MTAYSKAAKRRARMKRRGLITLPGETVPAPRGQGARHDRLEPPASTTVLEARARMMHTTTAAANTPILSDPAGQAIWLETGRDKPTPEQAQLWRILCDVSRVYGTFCASIGKSPHAKCGKVEYLPDRFEARADDRPDLRTREEKDIAASRAWHQWKRAMETMPRLQAGDLWDGIMLQREMVKDGRATLAGQAFVRALRALRQIVGD